jgi:hypothetical protein
VLVLLAEITPALSVMEIPVPVLIAVTPRELPE